ncbi:MAG: DUF192 domain-containing protein [Candidatus Aenigmatarchaeota archaeon]|nr:MAG: DUF192 domain-containing protein [Candidatus Aenigmarchaeota archaeon]
MIVRSANGKIVTEDTQVARNFFSKTLGLMFRRRLDEKSGLLLEFGKESKDLYSVWMLGMFFPIDIIFINAEREITDIHENASPLSLNPVTWKVYRPTKPVKWILEVVAGRAGRAGISAGERLEFV